MTRRNASSPKKFRPKNPDSNWLMSYFNDTFRQSKAYSIADPKVDVKLDQNESPWDWPDTIKNAVLEKLGKLPWNLYPPAYSDKLRNLLANYVGVECENILLGPGSNYLITICIDTFCRNISGDLYIARPSFALYEAHCRYTGITYKTWYLNENFQYEPGQLESMKECSVVLFASPNNPVGNLLKYDDLEHLLAFHPKSLFIADEAYFEFSDKPYTSLLENHDNIILIRTFSKAMAAASIRLGYVVGSSHYIEALRKLCLPFLVNIFSQICVETILENDGYLTSLEANVNKTIQMREELALHLQKLGARSGFEVVPSSCNFLLLKWQDPKRCGIVYNSLIQDGILVRNVSNGPNLAGCLRVSVGQSDENNKLIACLENLA